MFFALEVVLAAVVSAVVSQAIDQTLPLHEPALNLLNYTLGSLTEMPLYALLGLLLAPIAAAFIRSVYWQRDLWHKHVHWPRPLQTAFAGAVVGLVGVFLPQILGPGRETMNEVLSAPGEFTIWLLLIVGTAKFVMTGFSLAGGFVGGVFAPTLFIGLMFGSVFGRALGLLGMVSRHDVVAAYNKAITRKLEDQHHAEQVRLSHVTGAHVLEMFVAAGAPVAGTMIRDVHWPAESVVASISRRNKLLVPHGDTELRAGDWVTMVAAPECETELAALFGQRPVVV